MQRSPFLTELVSSVTGWKDFPIEHFDALVALGIVIQLGTFSGQILEGLIAAQALNMLSNVVLLCA
jgi:hypothetical protein